MRNSGRLKMAATFDAVIHNFTNSSRVLCPHSIENCSDGRVSYDIGTKPSYVAIASSSVSCLGSLLIIFVYFHFKDLRSSAQKIITFLAVADLISALGYIGGSINFLYSFNVPDHNQCRLFTLLCEAQASITSWSSLVSFSWTLTLAFYFYLVIIYSRRTLASRLMPLYHIVAWFVPLCIIVPLAGLKKLGYAPYAASNWCFVKLERNGELREVAYVLLAGKFWELSTYAITVYVYVHIAAKLIQRRRRYQPLQRSTAMERVERRLLYIPAFFVALRMWGTIQFFYSITVYKDNHQGCILKQHHTVFTVLGYLQAIGDPGQGWGNAIVYVMLSPMVRRKLIPQACHDWFKSSINWLVSLASASLREERQPLQTTGEHHNAEQQSSYSSSRPRAEFLRQAATLSHPSMLVCSADGIEVDYTSAPPSKSVLNHQKRTHVIT